jgi:P-aminobenzoate N-oxygenase AurF
MSVPKSGRTQAWPTETKRPMAAWDACAMVRSRTRDYHRNSTEGHYFKPSLMKVLGHPALGHFNAAELRELEILQLARYLYSVEQVETQLINPALLEIVQLDLPPVVRLDAYKIYTDEGYHALMSAELMHEILARHGLEQIRQQFPTQLQRVLNCIAELPTGPRNLALITAASLNETLISANLSQADDPNLVSSVREMIHQHRVDEARHHGYFMTVFPELWRRWPAEEREMVAGLIPRLLIMLLSTDVDPIARDLERFGLDGDAALSVVSFVHRVYPTKEELLEVGRGCFAMLRRAELVDHRSIRLGFSAEGFEI